MALFRALALSTRAQKVRRRRASKRGKAYFSWFLRVGRWKVFGALKRRAAVAGSGGQAVMFRATSLHRHVHLKRLMLNFKLSTTARVRRGIG